MSRTPHHRHLIELYQNILIKPNRTHNNQLRSESGSSTKRHCSALRDGHALQVSLLDGKKYPNTSKSHNDYLLTFLSR